MHFLHTFAPAAFLDSFVSYLAAFAFGTLIGAERQFRQRTAGLRTNALVALGAAAFVDLGQRLAGDAESVRVIAYVVSGIGFLGAGVIMKEGMNVRGLNTAATLWCSAAVGSFAGSDLLAEAAMLTGFVLLSNTALRPLVDAINRIPARAGSVEATYVLTVRADADAAGPLSDLVVQHLEAAKLPVAEVEVAEHGDEQVAIEVTLIATDPSQRELQAVVAHLANIHGIAHATWQARTRD